MDISPSALRFEPWRGQRYPSGGVVHPPLLILGESHYHEDPHYANPRFTTEVVEDYLSGRCRHRFFTSVMQVVSARTFFPYDLRRIFWDSVAFYNYIQDIVGASRGIRPTSQMWHTAKAPFSQLLHGLRPRCVLVCGWELWSHVIPGLIPKEQVGAMPTAMAEEGPVRAIFAAMPHPASRGFSSVVWHQSFRAVLAHATDLADTRPHGDGGMEDLR
jgi:hypothetical protein